MSILHVPPSPVFSSLVNHHFHYFIRILLGLGGLVAGRLRRDSRGGHRLLGSCDWLRDVRSPRAGPLSILPETFVWAIGEDAVCFSMWTETFWEDEQNQAAERKTGFQSHASSWIQVRLKPAPFQCFNGKNHETHQLCPPTPQPLYHQAGLNWDYESSNQKSRRW